MLLSIGLMVKNESKHLEECLKSLMPILNEIESELIIVDTGSTDSTVQIAQRFTDKVYFHEWFDDFAGMRNVVLSYAVGEWFFYVDGDEILEDPSGIIAFFKSGRHKKYNAAFINMRNPVSSKEPQKWVFYQALRFFRKDKHFHFRGIIHEQPQAKGPVAHIEGTIVHYGYIADDKELMEYKFNRNVALIQKVLEKDPDNIYHLYQLSQSYAMYNKHAEALESIEKAYVLAKEKGLLSRYMYVVIQLASVYFNTRMFPECENICREGLRIKDGYLDLYYFLAVSQAELGKLEESVVSFQNYLSLVQDYERGKGTVDFSVAHRMVGFTEHAYATLCELLYRQGKHAQAVEHAKRVSTPGLVERVVPYLVDIYSRQRDFQAIKALYDKWKDDGTLAFSIKNEIEKKRLTLTATHRRQLSKALAEIGTEYGLLNVARVYCLERLDRIPQEFWEQMAVLDLSCTEVYYADLVLCLLMHGKPVANVLKTVRTSKITEYFLYLFRAHEGFLDVMKSVLDDEIIWQLDRDVIHVPRIKSAALYATLQQKSLRDEDYERLFKLYLELGLEYLEHCYSRTILDSADVTWARTDADAFLLVIRKAKTLSNSSAEYVRCLREALKQDKTMKRGVQMLLEEVQGVVTQQERDELEGLKRSLLETIEKAINAGDFETAFMLITEYEDAVGSDASICSARGIIHLISGDLDAAREAFLKGLEYEPDNEDLIYNLSYLDRIMEAG